MLCTSPSNTTRGESQITQVAALGVAPTRASGIDVRFESIHYQIWHKKHEMHDNSHDKRFRGRCSARSFSVVPHRGIFPRTPGASDKSTIMECLKAAYLSVCFPCSTRHTGASVPKTRRVQQIHPPYDRLQCIPHPCREDPLVYIHEQLSLI